MRKAVNYAIDRTALCVAHPPVRRDPHRPVPAPGDAGLRGHRGLSRRTRTSSALVSSPTGSREIRYGTDRPSITARRAARQPGNRPRNVHDRACSQIGIDATMVGWAGGDIYYRDGPPRRAVRSRRQRRLVRKTGSTHGTRCSSWTGRRSTTATGNLNYAYFNDPVFNDRMHAAAELTGDARYDAFRDIEHDLVRDAAPWAAWRTYNNSNFFSKRIGCQHTSSRVHLDRLRSRSACGRRSRPTT